MLIVHLPYRPQPNPYARLPHPWRRGSTGAAVEPNPDKALPDVRLSPTAVTRVALPWGRAYARMQRLWARVQPLLRCSAIL